MAVEVNLNNAILHIYNIYEIYEASKYFSLSIVLIDTLKQVRIARYIEYEVKLYQVVAMGDLT